MHIAPRFLSGLKNTFSKRRLFLILSAIGGLIAVTFYLAPYNRMMTYSVKSRISEFMQRIER